MIHLHRLIKQLRKLTDKEGNALIDKEKAEEIRKKSKEIMEATRKLMREHGDTGDVGAQLHGIYSCAGDMIGQANEPLWGHAFNYERASFLVKTMEEHIQMIGYILKIEFKEVES